MLDRLETKRAWATSLALILLVAAALRVGIVAHANNHADRFMWPDSERYLLVAANIAAGQGPIVSPFDRTGADPAYPLLLSWPARLGATNPEAVAAWGRWLNVPAGLASVVFAAYLGRLLYGALAGLLAGAILAVHPIQIYFHGLVLTEVIYTALLVGSLYALARYAAGGGAANLFLVGVGLGLATLMRGSALLLPLFVLPLAVWAGWRREAAGRAGGAATAAVVLLVCYVSVLLPSTYRNWRILHAFVPVRTGAGASLLEAVNPAATGGPGMEHVAWPEYPPGADEYERDRINRAAAVEYIKQDPGRFLRLAGVKFLRTWNIGMNEPAFRRPLYDVLAVLSSVPVYALAVIGWWRHRRDWPAWYLLLAAALYFSLLHMVFVGSVRYRYPAMPGLIVLGAAALARRRPAETKSVGPGSEPSGRLTV